jgi:hypothetical protein
MKPIIALAALLLLAQTAKAQTLPDFVWWTPPAETVVKTEQEMNSRTWPHPLELAQRRYSGSVRNGRHQILAQYY